MPAARPAAPPSRRVGLGAVAASVSLHAAAAVAVTAAAAWRAAPVAPPPEVALQVMWLDARPAALPDAAAPVEQAPPPPREADPPAAPLGETVAEALEPEDLLATMLPDTAVPPPPALDQSARESEAPPPAEAPTVADAAAPSPQPSAAEDEAAAADRGTALAALAVPPPPPPAPETAPAPSTAAPPSPAKRERPRPPRAPNPAAAPAARPAPAPPRAEAAAAAAPAPPLLPAAPAERAPLVQGPPRFRRPPSPPVYPAPARERGEEGVVGLRLLVGADGATREVRLHRSSGNRLLDEAALAAARRWEVEPASVGGQRADAWVEVPVRFRLD